MTGPIWRFVSNQHSALVGINDAGIETFSSSVLSSLVRETIQNSLDAKLEGFEGPVLVEFSFSTMHRSDFPDASGFDAVLKKCYESNKSEPQAARFFKKAMELMKDNIPVLRISDHRTTGLCGADSCAKGTVWSRLVKESGSSNKADGSGGSFGIGKSAAFACSQLRTVFYTSIDKDSIESSIGVARLISFEQQHDEWTTGVGYYSQDNHFTAIRQIMSFEKGYCRSEKDSGTDVYIMGTSVGHASKQEMINSVLINFLVSIIKKKLIVSVDGSLIDATNIGEYVSKINPYDTDKALASVVAYYRLLTSADPSIKRISLNSGLYGAKYGFKDGECTLYLMEGENLNRRILMTRNAGMSLFEQDRFSSDIEFTGILMIEGATMNREFKEMEVPSHDAWKPSRCQEKATYYDNMFKELRRYLRDQVNESFGKVTSTVIDAFDAGEFLPDSSSVQQEKEERKGGIFERVRKLVGKESAPKKKKPRPLKVTPKPKDEEAADKDKKKKSKEKDENKPPKDKAPNFKPVTVNTRAICTDPQSGKYIIKFIVPKKAKAGRLDVAVSGEVGDFDVPITSAKVLASYGTSISTVEDNSIYLGNLIAGDHLSLEVNIAFDAYCMLEVQYYENKK